jgi:hypothetical protein
VTSRRALTTLTAVALLTVLGGCSQGTEVEGVKYTSSPTVSAQALQPTATGGLAVRLLPPAEPVVAGQPVTLDVQYADAHGGLVGTVEDFGDGGIGGLKLSDCHDSETNPSSGTKHLRHVWDAAGTYRVSVTVTTLSCVHGQEDVTATADIVVAAAPS